MEYTYVPLPPTSPQFNAEFNLLLPSQTHLRDAPTGISPQWVWNIPGGTGGGQKIIDVEGGWDLAHEDLPPGISRLFGANDPDYAFHGTSVLGILVANNNGLGGVGIAPFASASCISFRVPGPSPGSGPVMRASMAAAVGFAAGHVTPGDILLLEIQLGPPPQVPAEADPAMFSHIRTMSAAGVIVIEPAANGGISLDTYKNTIQGTKRTLSPDSPDYAEVPARSWLEQRSLQEDTLV